MPCFEWLCCKKDLEKRKVLEQILPQDYKYKINGFKVTSLNDVINETNFEATILVNVCDPLEIETFLTEFKDLSNTDYNKFKADTKETKNPPSIWQEKMHT